MNGIGTSLTIVVGLDRTLQEHEVTEVSRELGEALRDKGQHIQSVVNVRIAVIGVVTELD